VATLGHGLSGDSTTFDTWDLINLQSWEAHGKMRQVDTCFYGKLEGWHIADMMEIASWTSMWHIESWRLIDDLFTWRRYTHA